MRQIPFGKPILGDEEKQAVCEVMDTGILAHGPRIQEFEAAFAGFTGAPHAVGVASCTAALHLTYLHLGIGPGDEVIVPAMTHVATAHAVEFTGAKPVFVDAESRSGNLDVAQIETAITRRTKALSVVHFLGMPVDMAPVMDIARRHRLFVVEDCALAIGARLNGVHTGLLADVGCFSFYPVKHLTTAEGGMLITRHQPVAEAVRRLRAFGMDKHVGERKTPGLYDVTTLGYNYRLNELQAAIGIEQMKRLPEFIETRRRNHEAMTAGLSDIDEVSVFESSHDGSQSSYYCHAVVLSDALADKRFELINALRARGVGTSIYYPHPVPRMAYYAAKYGYRPGSFPVAECIADQSIALPVGPHVTIEDVRYIIEALKEAIHEVETA